MLGCPRQSQTNSPTHDNNRTALTMSALEAKEHVSRRRGKLTGLQVTESRSATMLKICLAFGANEKIFTSDEFPSKHATDACRYSISWL